MKGWKTIAFNVIMAVILLAEQLGAQWGLSVEIVAIVSTIGNFILRFFTSTPVTKSE